MKHLGDITRINGHEAPPVDIITGGSPCQDLSVAGKRAGLAGERSGLFMEQIRIIKEMRNESREHNRTAGGTNNNIRPRYMVWENVAGAFSSNNGEDFRAVLEETARIEEAGVCIPGLEEGQRWPHAGCIMGNGWSIAWRLHDAQHWGVPQRRKRISLVADFGGDTAPKILFEPKSLPGNTEQSGEEKKTAPGNFGEDAEKASVYDAYQHHSVKGDTPLLLENHPCDGRLKVEASGICQTLRSRMGTGGGNAPLVLQEPILLESNQNHATVQTNGISTALTASMGMGGGYVPMITQQEPISIGNGQLHDAMSPSIGVSKTLNCMDDPAKIIAYGVSSFGQYSNQITSLRASGGDNGGGSENLITNSMTVRRLTPMECERLQGYPDGWTDIGEWTDSKGKKHKESDGPRYKALGNSIALPFWEWMAERMINELQKSGEATPTMASLFDGIGGFPLVYSRHGCEPVWASEIEEFPMAVTRARFPEQ